MYVSLSPFYSYPSIITKLPQTQYGNILRVLPDDQTSPLLQPANEHKQLVVIDFEYASANLPGLEFANHFSEWTYNYHDPARPHACDTSRYPTPEEQRRSIKAYVDHRPQLRPLPYTDSPSAVTPNKDGPEAPPPPSSSLGALHANVPASSSSSSIVEFMLDARVPAGGWKEEERRTEEEREGKIAALLEETRLWRTANSAQWVAWGIVQAKIPGLVSADVVEGKEAEEKVVDGGVEGKEEGEKEAEEEFDYLAYAQDRAYFFLGDCVLLGLVKVEELGPEVRQWLKVVEC